MREQFWWCQPFYAPNSRAHCVSIHNVCLFHTIIHTHAHTQSKIDTSFSLFTVKLNTNTRCYNRVLILLRIVIFIIIIEKVSKINGHCSYTSQCQWIDITLDPTSIDIKKDDKKVVLHLSIPPSTFSVLKKVCLVWQLCLHWDLFISYQSGRIRCKKDAETFKVDVFFCTHDLNGTPRLSIAWERKKSTIHFFLFVCKGQRT